MQIIGVEGSEQYHAPVYHRGDVGPGGGLIIYKAASTQTWGTYIEMALPGWHSGGDPTVTWANSSYYSTATGASATYAYGGAYINTSLMLAQDASNPAAAPCRAFTGGGFTDWSLGSYADWLPLNVNFDSWFPSDSPPGEPALTSTHITALALSNSSYWGSEEVSSTDAMLIPISAGRANGSGSTAKNSSSYIRPVRYF